MDNERFKDHPSERSNKCADCHSAFRSLFDVGLRAGQSNEINRFYTGVARGLDLEMLLARQDSSRGRRKSERGVSMIKIASDRP